MSYPSSASSTLNEPLRANKRAKIVSPSPSPECQQQIGVETTPVDINHIISIVQTMKLQESTVYKPSYYLEGTVVTEQDRTKMCQWGYSIADACRVDRKVASVAISYFDRFLSHRGIRSVEVSLARHREFQLAFIVCFVIALKGRENIKITPDFVKANMCSGMYHITELVNMEVEVLRTIGWRLSGPTPQDFIEYFVELLPSSLDESIAKIFLDEATKKSEAAMMDFSMALEPFSCIAVTALAAVAESLVWNEHCEAEISNWMSCIGIVLGSV